MAANDTAGLLRAGIQAARMGNRVEAQRLLKQVLALDDSNESAWMWMASVVETPRERRTCLETVLELNPDNTRARQELERINQLLTPVSDPAPSVSPVPPKSEPITAELGTDRPRQIRLPRRITPMMFLMGLLFVGVIGIGLALIAITPPPVLTVSPTFAANTLSFSALQQTQDAKAPLTRPARSTVIVITPNLALVPPSWTPLPSLTSPPSATPSATPMPLTGLTFLFAGEGRGRQNIGLYIVGGNGKTEQLLLAADVRAFNGDWSPDGKQIAYITDVGGKEQLAVMNADGSAAQTLTQLKGTHVRSPVWSPDGKQIAFSSDHEGNEKLYTVSADGSNLKPLTDSKTDERDPTFSPDGKQLAYAADATGRGFFQIYLLDVESGKSIPLTASQNSSYSPDWSPDGQRIAFVSTRDQHANIYTMNPDGSDEQLLTFDDNNAENRDPAWSPDSRWIVFSSNRADGVYNIYAMLPDGSRVTAITQQKDISVGPRFRPGP